MSLVQEEGEGHLMMAALCCDQTANRVSLVQDEGEGHLTMATLCWDQTANHVTCTGGGRGVHDDGHVVL